MTFLVIFIHLNTFVKSVLISFLCALVGETAYKGTPSMFVDVGLPITMNDFVFSIYDKQLV